MRIVKPKGTLIPIGGGEDKDHEKEVLSRVIAETGKKRPCITLITVATGLPEEVAGDYSKAFEDMKIGNLNIIYFNHRNEADSEENLAQIDKCNAVMFSGGDQLKLSSLMGGTRLLARIKERYYDEPDFVVAGTSAGAAAMSNTMIISGSSIDALIKGELELTNGLDLINSVFIDTHFTQRGRVGRLIQTVTANPGVLGIGLGEDTALVIHKGEEMEVVGSGLVMVVDGAEINYTDLTELSDGDPITVEGVKVHVLGFGKKFLISERRLKAEQERKKQSAA